MGYRKLPKESEMPPIFNAWLDWLPLLEDKPPNTIKAYNQGVRRVLSYAEKNPNDLSPDFLNQAELTDTVRSMRSSGEMSKATLNQTLAALNSFYDFCIADGLIKEVPDIKRIRKVAKLDVPQVDPEYYRPSEIRDLYETAASNNTAHGKRVLWPERDLAMCSFLAVLGLRASELIDADINWISRERLIDNDDQATWMMQVIGKGRRIRRLPLSPELVEVNEIWQKERSERFGTPRADDPLFVTKADSKDPGGKRFTYQNLRYWLRILNRIAGLRERSPHSLRHTAGVQLASDGVPINAIQSLLGHANISTTSIYTELAGGELVGVVKKSGANTLLRDTLKGE